MKNKKVLAIILSVFILSASVLSTNIFAVQTGTYADNIVGVYNYDPVSVASESNTYYLATVNINKNICMDIYKYYGDWYAMYNLALSLPVYKGAYETTIHQTISQTISAQSAFAFGTSIGGTASAECYGVGAEVCGGLSTTIETTFGIEAGMEYGVEITVDAEAPSGYYKIGICQNIYRHNIFVRPIVGPTSSDYTYDMPFAYDAPYYALLYSSSSSSTGYGRV